MSRTLGVDITTYTGRIMDPIKSSTSTMAFNYEGVRLHEEHDIHRFEHPPAPINIVESNYGRYLREGYVHTEQPQRKKIVADSSKRRKGTGLCFTSQITFHVASLQIAGKVYKIKVFRTGCGQIPGVLELDLSDMHEPLEPVRVLLEQRLGCTARVVNINAQLRNCKTILSDLALKINTSALGALIERECEGDNVCGVFSVEYRTAQHANKVYVKFLRPSARDPYKQTTLKVLQRKINIEGAVDIADVARIYTWLNDLLLDNYYEVIIDPDVEVVSDSDDDEPPAIAAAVPRVVDTYDPYAF